MDQTFVRFFCKSLYSCLHSTVKLSPIRSIAGGWAGIWQIRSGLSFIIPHSVATKTALLSISKIKFTASYTMGDADRDLDKCFEVVMKLVDEAGKIVSERNDTRKSYVCKSGAIDLVTETDQEVEKLLMNGLKAEFPSHKFIGEEESSVGGAAKLTDAPTWIIDPVDGTMNFVHGFPHSCISIGLLVDKVAEIGIVYNPMLQQKFTARRGQGAFYNGRQINVSGEKDLAKALITTEFGTTRDPEKMKIVNGNFAKMVDKVHGIRTLGSAALNMVMVAMGAADANYEFGVHAWDTAAGDIIVREAGGVVIDPAGGPFDNMSRRVLAASSQELAQQIVETITQYYPLPRDD